MRRGPGVALGVAQGLHFMHRARIVHLDLKSANVSQCSTIDGSNHVDIHGWAWNSCVDVLGLMSVPDIIYYAISEDISACVDAGAAHRAGHRQDR